MAKILRNIHPETYTHDPAKYLHLKGKATWLKRDSQYDAD